MAREPKDVEETEDENPLTAIMERAESLGLEDDEFDDYVEKRMERKGYKRGPGDWIPIESDDDDEDDEDDEDDDDTPVTRGDIRRMRRSQGRNRRASISSPPRKKREKAKENGRETRSRRDPWWE